MVKRGLKSVNSISKMIIMITTPITLSIILAVIPDLAIFEDYFVNGLYYDKSPLFVGPIDKEGFYAAFNARSPGTATKSTWRVIRSLVADMFTSDHGGVSHKTIGFYGNDGTCIFKYLVTRDDPQWIFSISIVTINFLCFIFVASSYVILAIRTGRSARGAGNAQAAKRQRTLQRKVTAIIITDFLCWVPLSIVSFLHLGEVIQATSWYAYFSILIIPINSVINPLLYDPLIFKYLIQKPTDVVNRVLKKGYNSKLFEIFRSLDWRKDNVEPQAAQIPETPEDMSEEDHSDQNQGQEEDLNVQQADIISVDLNAESIESFEKKNRKELVESAQSPETSEEMPEENIDPQQAQEDDLDVQEQEILVDVRDPGDEIVESFELTQQDGLGHYNDFTQDETIETAFTE
eukprot:sb/3465301/